MKKKIAILGAFDRFNYGDLLFPVVLEKVLNQAEMDDFTIEYYGMCQSDLSKFGGKTTHPIDQLFAKGNLPADSVVIVAGGEVLGATWFKLHRYILSQQLSLPLRVCNKLFNHELLDSVSRKAFGLNLLAPFVVGPDDFNLPVKVVYNTVGGSSLKYCSERHRKKVIGKIAKAHSVSVRDWESKKLLETPGGCQKVELLPDSAIYMSELFPREELDKVVSKETREIIKQFPKGYICFQTADDHSRDSIPHIVKELEAVYKKTGLGVVLLPIGRASGHEDQIPLEKIKQHISTPAVMPGENGIFDIMALIANSKLYAGTSLHGAITALSFAVPHLGLTDKVPKLEAFLNTWSVKDLNGCIPFSALAAKAPTGLSVETEQLKKKSEELIHLTKEGFDRMMEALDIKSSAA